MIVNIKGVWKNAVQPHNAYVETALNAAIKKNARRRKQYVRDVLAFVARNRKEILDPDVTDFANVIQDFDATFPATCIDLPLVMQLLKDMFDYDTFRDAKKGWNAYQLCWHSTSATCPYCHLVCTPTELPTPQSKGVRPHLDHFYVRSTYPFLALSLGNLVPCCGDCNGSMLKHQINCLIHPHLHPQGDDESVRFVLEAKDPAQRTAPDFRAFRRPPQDYRIGVDIIANAAKAQASVATFKILTRYAPLAGQAYEIASFARKGGWIRSVLGAVGIEVKPRHYLEFDPQGDGYRGAALGRLRRDMYRQGGG